MLGIVRERDSGRVGGYRVSSIAKLHVEHIPAFGTGSLGHRLDGMFVGNQREAIPVGLPAASRRAVGREELRVSLGCRMAVDGVVLRVGQRRERVEGY